MKRVHRGGAFLLWSLAFRRLDRPRFLIQGTHVANPSVRYGRTVPF